LVNVMAVFEATCEICSAPVQLTDSQQQKLIGPNGEFQCRRCTRPPRIRRRYDPEHERNDGCIVTIEHSGRLWSYHRDGKTLEALRLIVAGLPADAVVLSISTPRTIARDLKGPWRRNRGLVDAYAVERHLLGKIERLDLLPSQARPLFDRADRRR
jgi:hypothetical protein